MCLLIVRFTGHHHGNMHLVLSPSFLCHISSLYSGGQQQRSYYTPSYQGLCSYTCSIYTSTCTGIHVHVHACIHTHVQTHTHTHTLKHVLLTHTCMYAHAHTHTHTHTHTHNRLWEWVWLPSAGWDVWHRLWRLHRVWRVWGSDGGSWVWGGWCVGRQCNGEAGRGEDQVNVPVSGDSRGSLRICKPFVMHPCTLAPNTHLYY